MFECVTGLRSFQGQGAAAAAGGAALRCTGPAAVLLLLSPKGTIAGRCPRTVYSISWLVAAVRMRDEDPLPFCPACRLHPC